MPFKNEEDRIAWSARYYRANKEQIDAKSKQWARDNPDKYRIYNDNWRQRNRERHLELSRKYASNYRARKKDAFIESVDHMTVFERDGGICQICHEPIGESSWHIDHIMPLVAGGEHSYTNVQLTHATCNQRKWAKIP